MWNHYRKTFVPIQTLIVLGALALLLIVRMPLAGVLLMVLTMEAASFIGAAWATRLKRKINAARGL